MFQVGLAHTKPLLRIAFATWLIHLFDVSRNTGVGFRSIPNRFAKNVNRLGISRIHHAAQPKGFGLQTVPTRAMRERIINPNQSRSTDLTPLQLVFCSTSVPQKFGATVSAAALLSAPAALDLNELGEMRDRADVEHDRDLRLVFDPVELFRDGQLRRLAKIRAAEEAVRAARLAEIQRLKAVQTAAVERLHTQAAAWRKAQDLRVFIAAVEGMSGLEDAQRAEWLSWARSQADGLDPLSTDPARVLGVDFDAFAQLQELTSSR